MKINYNVTGADRKKLVLAIVEITGETMNYKGAPTFGYGVGRYYIDKTGVLIGEDNPDLVADLLGLHSFKAVSEEYDALLTEAEPIPEDIQIPYEAALGGRVSPYRDFEEPPAYGRPESDDLNLTVEMPITGFTDESLSNLEKIVASKATLIKKALGAEALPIEKTDTKIKFPWFRLNGDSGEAEAYSAFITGLCSIAKEQKRVTAKEKPVENEKFAFRVFLIRLGFIGDEYKAARKLLMKNLTGNSAFKNGAPKKEEEQSDE